MTTIFSKRAWAISLFTAFALSVGATSAHAQPATAPANTPTPTNRTPSMIGAQTVGAGGLVLGAASGYPETQFRAIFGMGDNFDLGIFAGVTYGMARIAGLHQRTGLDLQVPLRWTMWRGSSAAMALRVVPYFRIGQYDPAWSVGGLVGARFSIPLRKIFSILLGPEARLGVASFGQNVCVGTVCSRDRVNGFDGAVYAVAGLEAFFKERWHFNLQMDGGGYFASGALNGGGLFNVYVGFGYQLH